MRFQWDSNCLCVDTSEWVFQCASGKYDLGRGIENLRFHMEGECNFEHKKNVF